MIRRCLFLVCVLATPIAALGQAAGRPAASSKPEDERPPTIQLVLHPMGEPRPALKYVLLPTIADRRPGNAAVFWNRIPAEQNRFFQELWKEGGLWEKIDKWMQVPLRDPKAKELREGWDLVFHYSDPDKSASIPQITRLSGGRVFDDMDRAARFEYCDWQLPLEEGISLLLPEVQQCRGFGRLLAAKARIEISQGKFDNAVRTFQTGYALSRHVAEGQTLVNSLVGVAIASLMTNQVREFIQQPGAPNLYWALASLPRPLVDQRKGLEAEMQMLYWTMPELRDLRKKRSPEEWGRLLARLLEEISRWGGASKGEVVASPLAVAVALNGYPRAKQGLIDRGHSREEVEAMAVPQTILLYTVETYEELRDQEFKWMLLPYSQACGGLDRWEKTFQEQAMWREVIPLARLLLPAIRNARLATARNDRDLDALQICEAIRLYAAAHDGRLPDKLSDVTDVPIPTNAVTGRPFEYRRTGQTAVLEVDGPSGSSLKTNSFRYEIQMAPKGERP